MIEALYRACGRNCAVVEPESEPENPRGFRLRRCHRVVWVVVALATVALLAIPSYASAADLDEKISVSLVNAAGAAGEPVAEKLRTILREQNDLSYVSQSALLEAGDAHGVSLETFSDGTRRKNRADAIRKSMREAETESVLVLHVSGGTARIVALDPLGREVSDRARATTDGELPTSDAAELLKASFGEVVPAWKAWKRKRAESSTDEEDVDGEPEERIAVSLVNGADAQGVSVAAKLRRILESQDDVQYVEEQKLLESGASHGVTVETLRKGSEREAHVEDFRKTMRGADVETVLVLDVFSGKVQLVALDPRGREVADERRELSDGNLETKDAAALLKATFSKVVPAWKEWKREKATDDRRDGVAMPSLGAGGSSTFLFRVNLGPLFALRSMTLEGSDDEITHSPQPYAGLQFGASGTLARFPKLDASLQFDAELGYGASKNRELVPGQAAPITELTFGGIRFFAIRRLGNRISAGLGAGFQATSVIVQPNTVYTGHRYLAGDASLRVDWLPPAKWLSLTGELGAYPVFATDNSDSAHGEASSFGGRFSLEGAWNIAPDASSLSLKGLRVLTRYRYQRYRSTFPLSPLGEAGAHSVDNIHVFTVLIDYGIPAGLN